METPSPLPVPSPQGQRSRPPSGFSSVIRKVGRPPPTQVDAFPMYQCALCGVRYHFAEDLVRHVEKGKHFDVDLNAVENKGYDSDSSRKAEAEDESSETITPAPSSTRSSEAEGEREEPQPQNLVMVGGGHRGRFLDEDIHEDIGGGEEKMIRLRCHRCQVSFDSVAELRFHNKVTHALECKICGRGFFIQPSLDRHMAEEHGDGAGAEGVSTKTEFEEDSSVGSPASQVGTSGSTFASDVLIEPLEGCYRCKVCGKICAARSDMQKHVRRHTDERPYGCHICSERFKHRSAITNHLRIHTGERPYTCDYCGKTFSQHSNKRRHEALHRGERPFRCVLCSRTFSEKTTLQTHMLQHTGERPYLCDYCGKGHITKSALTRHKCSRKGEDDRSLGAQETLPSPSPSPNAQSVGPSQRLYPGGHISISGEGRREGSFDSSETDTNSYSSSQ